MAGRGGAMRIEKLPAGREMDKAISRYVFGNNEFVCRNCEDDYHVVDRQGLIAYIPVSNYSTDFAAAREVVKELKKQRWSFRYSNNAYADTQHAAAFYRRGIGRDILGGDYVYNDNAWAIANTECLAICRAALLAMGVTEL